MQRLIYQELAGRRRWHHIAATRMPPGESTFAHTHDFPEFFLLMEGAGTHVWNGRRVAVERGDLTLILPRDRHHFECGPEQALLLINLALDPRWWKAFASLSGPWDPASQSGNRSEAPFLRRRRKLSPGDAGRCGTALRELLAAGDRDPAILMETVAALLRALRASPGFAASDGPAAPPEWLARIVRDLQEPAAATLPVSHWQKRSNRSPEHLARCCRRYLGCTLTDLVIRARLARVKAGLREGSGKIAALAYDAGFQNLGYFYRAFRRAEGSTPKKWAAAHAAGPAVPR